MSDISNLDIYDEIALIQQLQQENTNMRHAMEQHQVGRPQVHVLALLTNQVPHPQALKELCVRLPNRFGGDCTKLQDFVD